VNDAVARAQPPTIRVDAAEPQWRRWRHRFDLVDHLARREFSLRYHNSTLGVLWFLAVPLAQLGILVFLFQRVIPLGIEAYPAFVFSALLPWSWFTASVSTAGGLFVGNRDLVRHPGFAPAILVIVNALSNLAPFVLSLPILFGLLGWYGRAPGVSLLFLPVLIAIQGVLIVGLGLGIATLNVFYRDVQHLVTVGLMLLFYVTPVFYRTHEVSEGLRWIFRLNPVAVLVECYRAVFFLGTVPAAGPVLAAAASSAGICAIAYWVYRAHRHDLVDAL
jgi:ABC-type polysaccharide/polyol phosphate export permease